MIALLLTLHLAILYGLYRLLEPKVGRVISIVFFAYMGAFTALKPALAYYFDLYFPYSTNDTSAIASLLYGSLLFLCVQYWAIHAFGKYRPGPALTHWFDLSRSRPLGIWLTFVFLMITSYMGSAIRFSDLGYWWSSASTFDADMSQANGSYYINFLAESLLYGVILVIAYYQSRTSPQKLFGILLFTLTLTYLWARLATRTGVLVVLIAWLACSMSKARQRSFRLIYIAVFGYFLLVLLYVGNHVRLGDVGSMNLSSAMVGAVASAASDMNPVDSAALLYSEMHNHESTHFAQLAGAISPLVLIPSSIFPIKLAADKDAELTRMFFPAGIDLGLFSEGSTLTFTVPASGYADAGYFGVLISSLIYAGIFGVYLAMFVHGSSSAKFVAAVLLLVHIVGYRLSVESLLVEFYWVLLLIGFLKWLSISLSTLYSVTKAGISSASNARTS